MIHGQNGREFTDSIALQNALNAVDGKSLGEIDSQHVFQRVSGMKKVTGIAGTVIEQSVLSLLPNNEQEPDIVIEGVPYEVKATGVRESKNGETLHEAKEPLSITAVSVDEIAYQTYQTSHFWKKINHLLIFYYFYDSPTVVRPSQYASFKLECHQFLEYSMDFTLEEQLTLENDWTLIHDFIVSIQHDFPCDPQSQYPRLASELRGNLMLIDTAPKWPHKPRFRFKRCFVTCLYRRRITQNVGACLPNPYTKMDEIKNKCGELQRQFGRWTIGDICQHFGMPIPRQLKSIAEQIIVQMFGGNAKKMNEIELFCKMGLDGKSIVLTKEGMRTEDTKLFKIDFDEIRDPNLAFEDSQFYDYFSTTNILFILFEEPSVEAALTENRFVGFKKISFSDQFITERVRPVWMRIRELVQTGTLVEEIVRDKKGKPIINKSGTIKTKLNFPKSSEGMVFVRGGGEDATRKPECVNGIQMYYQFIWLKGSDVCAYLDGIPFFG